MQNVRVDMKIIMSPNRWSCLPCSFAMAAGISLECFLEKIGHDGSKIMWPDLEEPRCRRSFHLQECVVAALEFGLKSTMLEFQPTAKADDTHTYSFDQYVYVRQRMQRHQGVLLGMGRKVLHAVAWDGVNIFDPSIGVYDIENQNHFKPAAFIILN